MSIQALFITANTELLQSIQQIKADQWDLILPSGASFKPTTLQQAVRYHTYDDAWVPDILAGKTIEAVGDQYDYLLTGEDVAADYARFNLQAREAVSKFAALADMVHLSYGDFTAREYLQHIVSFRAFRCYDIAKIIGINTTMNERFVAALLAEYSPVIESYRQMGVFPPALEVSDHASPQVKLLAMVGRS
jgi:hypothetical protein